MSGGNCRRHKHAGEEWTKCRFWRRQFSPAYTLGGECPHWVRSGRKIQLIPGILITWTPKGRQRLPVALGISGYTSSLVYLYESTVENAPESVNYTLSTNQSSVFCRNKMLPKTHSVEQPRRDSEHLPATRHSLNCSEGPAKGILKPPYALQDPCHGCSGKAQAQFVGPSLRKVEEFAGGKNHAFTHCQLI